MQEIDNRQAGRVDLKADSMPAGIYTRQEYDTGSPLYVLLPQHEVAIPYRLDEAKTASILIEQLVDHGDVKSSQDIVDYPIVTHRQLEMWYDEYTIVSVLKNIHVYKPTKALSGWDIRQKQDKVDKHRGHVKHIAKQNKQANNPFFQVLTDEQQATLRRQV